MISALLPFAVLLLCFVGMRLPLTWSAGIALVINTLLTFFAFHTSPAAWQTASVRTFEISVEIGLIILGAFFFLEVGKKVGVIDSFAALIKEVSPNRIVQCVLVSFPLELLVEGSSGFGTPFLVIAPLLFALGFSVRLCALLPLLSCVCGVPFGALGTPIRLGFPGQADVSHQAALLMLPLVFLLPLLSAWAVRRKLETREVSWILLTSFTYAISSFLVSFSGPEFSTLAPALITFTTAVFSARLFFRSSSRQKMKSKKGLAIYAALFFVMWFGKQLWMDRVILHTHIRMFNPGFVFIAFAGLMILFFKPPNPQDILTLTFHRAKKTLIVFFCLSFVVQQMRESGALLSLTQDLPTLLLSSMSPVLGWFATFFIGTSTVTNLLLSKVVDPLRAGAVACGSAIGVQLTFQSMITLKSTLHDQISEKEIFAQVLPYSLLCITVLMATYLIESAWL